jgi:transcriptional regulator with PAS, ATPase and Fis domain
MNMDKNNIPFWENEFNAAITIADAEGYIIYKNEKAIETFASDGGEQLIGKNLNDCHQPRSMGIIKEIMSGGLGNTYTIEKKGKRKLIYQAPRFQDGICSGIVELSIELPPDMPHYIRD